MNFKDILNFKLIETENHIITIYSILLVLLIFIATTIVLKVIRKLDPS
jgi:hypothetical protein